MFPDININKGVAETAWEFCSVCFYGVCVCVHCLSLSVCPSVCLSVNIPIPVCLSVFHVSVSVFLNVCVGVSNPVPDCLSVNSSVSVSLSVSRCVRLCVCLSVSPRLCNSKDTEC